jgi:hypothetical protein
MMMMPVTMPVTFSLLHRDLKAAMAKPIGPTVLVPLKRLVAPVEMVLRKTIMTLAN